MSIAEELHKAIDGLSEEQQRELLEVANQLLRQQDSPETDSSDYQALLNELLVKRFEQYKAHPETGISGEDASRRIRLKYGWAR
ncbi:MULTISPECIES: hypothetical protein [unclassified Spirosoma]|uniref:hypothetical protein n=1 Tax=unclassified Spirosoma TaxID=2621999 RepID=UPI00096577F1|nr:MULTISPECIES: hypothetical protein [unclassified Spirosoma]MBN8822153.1 hypothetical protein [Spirosoma sp.]OJW80547.1 MAG: hypothetical protein BGO59_34290 [Spirosoma sp. 48-14]